MITLHEADANDFATLGLCALTPTECRAEERAGGLYELEMRHPITDDMRYTLFTHMRIIKAPVPVRETPTLAMVNAPQEVAREIWQTYTGGSRLYLRAGPSQSSKGLHAYRDGTEVIVLDKSDEDWYRVALVDGGASGYMSTDYLQFVRTEMEFVTGDAPSGLVKVQQSRDQLFRITEIEPDTRERSLHIRAQHISYDLAGAIVVGEYDPDGVDAASVCAQLLAKADHSVEPFTIYCAVDGNITGSYGGRNLIDCLLDPETGVAAQTHARVVRDNYDIYLLPDDKRDRGMEIRYGKNLLSASMKTDTSGIVTRIRPVGRDKDGDPLYIEENNGFVDSSRIHDYPVMYAREIQYDVVESDDLTISAARALLAEKAQEEFANGCDLAGVSLDADFVRLELTEEYRHLANAYALHMYDTVAVSAPDMGIVASVRMTGYRYDCLLNRYETTILGDISEANASVYGYELAGGIQGNKIAQNSMSGDRLRNLSVSYAKIGTAAIDQLSANAIEAVKATIRQLVAEEITTDQLYADLAYIAAAQITAANIDRANIQWAEIESLAAQIAEIAVAEIGTADIDYAKIKDLATNTAIITEGVAGELYISRLAVTEANMVSLTVGELMLKAEDGSFVRLVADGEGGVSTEVVQVENGNIANGTINAGEKIIEGSITADLLNVGQIFASSALIDAIKAQNIDVANLFAAEATISELNSYLVKASTIQALENSLSLWADEKITLAVGGIVDENGNAKGLDTGDSGVSAKLTSETFEVNVPGSLGDMRLGPDGGEMGVLRGKDITAPNVAARYAGPATLNVDPDATSEQVATGEYFLDLAGALATVNDRVLNKNLTIKIKGNAHIYGNTKIHGISGAGKLTIKSTSSAYDAILHGRMDINNVEVYLALQDLQIVRSANDVVCVIRRCGYVYIIDGEMSGYSPLSIYEGSHVYVYRTRLIGGTTSWSNAAYVSDASVAYFEDTKGTGRLYGTYGGIVLAYGTIPAGGVAVAYGSPAPANINELTPTTASGETASQQVTTATYMAVHTDTYGNGWGFGQHNDVVQGWNTGGGRIRGCMWFDTSAMSAAMSGKTIKQASLRLTMWTGVGRGTSVTVELSGTTKEYEGRTGSPAATTSYGVIGTTEPGETAEIAIPTAAITDLVNGTINALMLYSSDTEGYSGRGYSKNFAAFDGETSGTDDTMPRLTIIYQ